MISLVKKILPTRGADRHAKARIGHAAWLMHEHGKTADEAIEQALILWPHERKK